MPEINYYNNKYELYEIKTSIQYFNVDGKMTPVELRFAYYKDNTPYYQVVSDCTNLFDGSKIDFEEIRHYN